MTTSPLPDAQALYHQLVLAVRDQQPDYLVGIRTGGAWLTERVAAELHLPYALLDVAFHRDDYHQKGLKPHLAGSECKDSVEGLKVALIDDVVGTGRTVRAALNELFDFGRPRQVLLLALADRGGRELPIKPDWVGCELTLPAHTRLVLSQTASGFGFTLVEK